MRENMTINIKRAIRIVLSIILISGGAYAGELPIAENHGAKGNSQQEWQGSGYSVKIYRSDKTGEGSLEILKGDKQVYHEDNWKFSLGLIYDDIPEASLVQPGKDITGDKIPDLVVSHWSGGAHCCFDFYVFSLGDQFAQLAKIENNDGDLGKFVDVDGDGVLEFIGNDWTFSYWHAPFSQSPAPTVILEYIEGKYILALEKMKKPIDVGHHKELLENIRLDMADVAKNEKSMRELADDLFSGVAVPPAAWGYMLDLIYSGHPSEALSLVDDFWPKGADGKGDFLKEFMSQLSKSPYWNEISKTLSESKVS